MSKRELVERIARLIPLHAGSTIGNFTAEERACWILRKYSTRATRKYMEPPKKAKAKPAK